MDGIKEFSPGVTRLRMRKVYCLGEMRKRERERMENETRPKRSVMNSLWEESRYIIIFALLSFERVSSKLEVSVCFAYLPLCLHGKRVSCQAHAKFVVSSKFKRTSEEFVPWLKTTHKYARVR